MKHINKKTTNVILIISLYILILTLSACNKKVEDNTPKLYFVYEKYAWTEDSDDYSKVIFLFYSDGQVWYSNDKKIRDLNYYDLINYEPQQENSLFYEYAKVDDADYYYNIFKEIMADGTNNVYAAYSLDVEEYEHTCWYGVDYSDKSAKMTKIYEAGNGQSYTNDEKRVDDIVKWMNETRETKVGEIYESH